MVWSGSAGFRQTTLDRMGGVAAFNLLTDTIKAAVFDNSRVPDKDVSGANSALGAGQWVTDLSNGNWPAGGVTVANKTLTAPVTGVVMWDFDDPTAGPSVTLTGITGVLVYDTTISNRGISFHYLGGSSNAVTASTLTIQVSPNGAIRYTH
jgi:hypothetical protein